MICLCLFRKDTNLNLLLEEMQTFFSNKNRQSLFQLFVSGNNFRSKFWMRIAICTVH